VEGGGIVNENRTLDWLSGPEIARYRNGEWLDETPPTDKEMRDLAEFRRAVRIAAARLVLERREAS
jgi:hypothetical protein